jgi:leader peptidase (prepilin peptidase)/N-methyltransferase
MISIFVILFILGTIIGSFLNVLVVRGRNGESLMGRSHCMHCHQEIPIIFLIPILGYLISGRKCFSCKKNISIRYMIGELILGLLFMATGYFILGMMPFGLSAIIVMLSIVFITLIFYMSYYDILYQEIEMIVIIALFLIITGLHIFQPGSISNISNLLLGLSISVPFLLVWIISRGKFIGFGDILIMLLMGYHLGFYAGLSAIIISFWIGAVFVMVWIVYQKLVNHKTYADIRKIPIPFGPFLSTGWIITWWTGFTIFKIFLL